MKGKLFIVSALALSVLLGGCAGGDTDKVDNGTPVENAVDETEDLAEDVKEEAEDELKDAQDSIEDEVDKAEDAIEDAKEEVSDFEWPSDFMPNVPEFKGKIFKVNEKDFDHMYLAYENVTQEEAVEYIQSLKDAGFVNDADEYIASTVVNFKGYDKDGNFAKFRWSENGYATVDMIYPEKE